MTILGFNPSHHGSVCLLEDGELKFFIQEERVGRRIKNSIFPFSSFVNLIQNNKINAITWGTPSMEYFSSNVNKHLSYWFCLAQSFQHSNIYQEDNSLNHHEVHVSHCFYNSGFKEAIGIVIDGLGSKCLDSKYREVETIYKCSYPHNFSIIHKNTIKIGDYYDLNLSRLYETITMHLGWSIEEAGKTMGLAPYGKSNSNLPKFINKTKGNREVFFTSLTKTTSLPKQTLCFIDEEKNPQLKLPRDPREWHYDESKITDLEKDIAWKVQNETQQLVGDYIEEAVKETGLKQVCCAGGYFLNCVTNYYLLKRFPDIEFYFEPIANDAGTAIGSAKLAWHQATQDTTIRPFKSLYLGPKYSKEELLEGIKKYVDTP